MASAIAFVRIQQVLRNFVASPRAVGNMPVASGSTRRYAGAVGIVPDAALNFLQLARHCWTYPAAYPAAERRECRGHDDGATHQSSLLSSGFTRRSASSCFTTLVTEGWTYAFPSTSELS